jgi:hypothetical protein
MFALAQTMGMITIQAPPQNAIPPSTHKPN